MTARIRPSRDEPLAIVDLLRFAAAFAVLAYHLCAMFPLTPDGAVHRLAPALELPTTLARATGIGWVGVEIFFVLSGFVIAGSARRAGPGTFLRRRALRLLPAMWVCASITALALLAAGDALPVVAARWLAAVALYPALVPLDPSYWTLQLECVFYLMVALALGERDNARRVERLGIAIGLASTMFWLLAPPARLTDFALVLLLLPHGMLFALGIMLRAIRDEGATMARAAGALLFGGVALYEVVYHARASALPGDFALPLATAPLVFAGAVAALAAAGRIQAPLLALIPVRRLTRLGAMTYPLYLIHQQVAGVTIVALARLGLPAGAAMATAFAAMIALAWGIAAHAEPAVRRRLDAALSRRNAPAPDSRRIASLPVG